MLLWTYALEAVPPHCWGQKVNPRRHCWLLKPGTDKTLQPWGFLAAPSVWRHSHYSAPLSSWAAGPGSDLATNILYYDKLFYNDQNKTINITYMQYKVEKETIIAWLFCIRKYLKKNMNVKICRFTGCVVYCTHPGQRLLYAGQCTWGPHCCHQSLAPSSHWLTDCLVAQLARSWGQTGALSHSDELL